MLRIYIWDVQHGSACYINTPNGKNIVIDLGKGDLSSGSSEFSPLSYIKNNFGVNTIDQLIIAHPHADHLNDILNLDLFKVKIFSRPRTLSEAAIRKANLGKDDIYINKYLEYNEKYSYPVLDSEDPLSAKNNGNVSINLFSTFTCSDTNINNYSLVTTINFNGIKLLIPGDNEECSWKELLCNKDFINCIKNTHVLIASHHGRESGYCEELFDYFTPKVVIASDGPNTNTSVTSKYTEKAEGWPVNSRNNGKRETRYCLTTRNDGHIVLEMENNTLSISKD